MPLSSPKPHHLTGSKGKAGPGQPAAVEMGSTCCPAFRKRGSGATRVPHAAPAQGPPLGRGSWTLLGEGGHPECEAPPLWLHPAPQASRTQHRGAKGLGAQPHPPQEQGGAGGALLFPQPGPRPRAHPRLHGPRSLPQGFPILTPNGRTKTPQSPTVLPQPGHPLSSAGCALGPQSPPTSPSAPAAPLRKPGLEPPGQGAL